MVLWVRLAFAVCTAHLLLADSRAALHRQLDEEPPPPEPPPAPLPPYPTTSYMFNVVRLNGESPRTESRRGWASFSVGAL